MRRALCRSPWDCRRAGRGSRPTPMQEDRAAPFPPPRACDGGTQSRSYRRLLMPVFDQKADLPVHPEHGDLIVLDHDLGILDPKRADAAQGLGGLANGLAASVVKAV